MKTKNKRNKINKTRKGGHKVHYDYNGNIDAGTNRPLTGRHVNNNNCLACAMYSLGYMTERTARYLQRLLPTGVKLQMVLDMVNTTYGPGHTFRPYYNEESLKEYLKPGEATLGTYGSIDETEPEWGHFFIVFRSEKNGKLYIIDSQAHLVSRLPAYLEYVRWAGFQVLIEPGIKVRPKYKFIIPEVINEALKKEKARFEQYEMSHTVPAEPVQPEGGIQTLDDMFPDTQSEQSREYVIPSGVRNQYSGYYSDDSY
jgi:hypothetical protein